MINQNGIMNSNHNKWRDFVDKAFPEILSTVNNSRDHSPYYNMSNCIRNILIKTSPKLNPKTCYEIIGVEWDYKKSPPTKFTFILNDSDWSKLILSFPEHSTYENFDLTNYEYRFEK